MGPSPWIQAALEMQPKSLKFRMSSHDSNVQLRLRIIDHRETIFLNRENLGFTVTQQSSP